MRLTVVPILLSAFLYIIPIASGQDVDGDSAVALDYARIDSGTRVIGVSEGCNPPPYDVKAALGEGSHCSYPQAPPNWFILDLGQQRSIRAIEIDWRYTDKSADDFNLSFGETRNALDETIRVRGIGGKGKYWYRVLADPIKARFVKMEVLTLKNIDWTVINRLSLYGTSAIPRLMEQYSGRYAELSSRMSELLERARAQGVIPSQRTLELRDEVSRIHRLLQGGQGLSQEVWSVIEEGYLDLLQGAYDTESTISFAIARRARPGASVWVGAVSPMTRAFRHIWPRRVSSGVRLSCARNEWESGQIVVAAPESELSDVTVTWAPLRGPVTLDRSALEIQLVTFLKTESAPYATHHIGWWPDGLSPMASFSLPAGQVQPLWVTAKIPANAPAGEYRSAVTIEADGVPTQRVPVAVRVWDFALPTEITLPNIFSLSQLLVEAWYRRDKLTWDDLKHTYYDFWLDRRLNPTSLYGVKLPRPEDLDYCLERGMNTFVLEYIYNRHVREEEKFQVLLDRLAEWDPILREKGLYDRALVYLADEPSDKQSVTDEINRRAGIIGERFPAMRRFLVLTRPIDPAFEDSVDVWCPIVSAMGPEDVSAAHERGESCWWYTVGNFYSLDRPLAESRSMPWLTWKHDLDGILLWLLQSSWRKDNKPTRFKPVPGRTMWPEFVVAGHGGHNGIGNLCYPGPDGQPWSSVRLEMLRESMEDYEYLALLRRALSDASDARYAPLLTVPDQIAIEYEVGETGDFIMEHRRKLGEALHVLLGGNADGAGRN